jgi:hypothetical protein
MLPVVQELFMSDACVPVVSIGELKAVVNLILDHMIQDLKVDSVAIENEFYWDMDRKYLYDVHNKTPVLDIGSLHDDWEFLAKMGSDRRDAARLMLVHVAPLLRYIGEKVGQ